LIDRRPSTKSTLVFSATRTSDRLARSTGSTSTTASVRSLAVTRTRAPATCTVAAMGPEVVKVSMMIPLSGNRSAGERPVEVGQARLVKVERAHR
jgi:hypothetical protein